MLTAPVILKIGGSIITRKKQRGGFRKSGVERIADEILLALKRKPQGLILIHGAGGKAHALAHAYKLKNGARNKEKIFGALRVHEEVISLRKKIAAVCWKAGLPVFPIQTSSVFYFKNSKLVFCDAALIVQALNQGLIPLLHGDMVLDSEKGFSILSGDTIIARCAGEFKSKKILFATDVDGVFTCNPHENKKAKLLPEIDGVILKKIAQRHTGSKNTHDTTGEMSGKLANIIDLNYNVTIRIFNGLKKGNIKAVLLGEKIGTVVTPTQ